MCICVCVLLEWLTGYGITSLAMAVFSWKESPEIQDIFSPGDWRPPLVFSIRKNPEAIGSNVGEGVDLRKQ